LWVFLVVCALAMSIRPRLIPFQHEEEQSRKNGSTHSSLEEAPSPTGPTSRSSGTTLSLTSIGPDWLPRSPSPSQFAGSELTSSPMIRKQERLE
jgi:hypothetical protein